MIFNEHYNLSGKHSFLSGSSYHWINYTPEKLKQVFLNSKAKEEGTQLHAFASAAIDRRIKLAKVKKALNMFVNDAIGFGMISEQVLYYSDNCFGTADAILFKDGVLRIHDLKTGVAKVSFSQLDIYAAMFCLEYSVDPFTITIIERIYQGNDVVVLNADPQVISEIMQTIITSDIIIENIKNEIK